MSSPDPSILGDSDSNDPDSARLLDEGFSSSSGSDSDDDDDDVVIDNVDPALLKDVKSIVIKDESDSGDDSDSSSLSGAWIVHSSDDEDEEHKDERYEKSKFDANLIRFENDDAQSTLVEVPHNFKVVSTFSDVLQSALSWTKKALKNVSKDTEYVNVVSSPVHCKEEALETETTDWHSVLEVIAIQFCSYCHESRSMEYSAEKSFKMRSTYTAIHTPVEHTGGKVLQVYVLKFDIKLGHRKAGWRRRQVDRIHKILSYAILSEGDNVFFHIKEEIDKNRDKLDQWVDITPQLPLRAVIDSGHTGKQPSKQPSEKPSKQPAKKHPEVMPAKNPHRTMRNKLSSCMDQTCMAQTGIAQTGVDQRRIKVDAPGNLVAKQTAKYEQRKQIKEAAIKAARSKKSSTKKSSVNEAVNEAVITEAATNESAISNQPMNQHQNHITFM
jgi:hypothetical protein